MDKNLAARRMPMLWTTRCLRKERQPWPAARDFVYFGTSSLFIFIISSRWARLMGALSLSLSSRTCGSFFYCFLVPRSAHPKKTARWPSDVSRAAARLSTVILPLDYIHKTPYISAFFSLVVSPLPQQSKLQASALLSSLFFIYSSSFPSFSFALLRGINNKKIKRWQCRSRCVHPVTDFYRFYSLQVRPWLDWFTRKNWCRLPQAIFYLYYYFILEKKKK